MKAAKASYLQGRLGHPEAIRYGGGVIFCWDGLTYLEYTEGSAVADRDELEVFRTHLEDDVLRQFKIDTETLYEICESLNGSMPDWLRAASSSNVVRRAMCVVEFATYTGWENVDDDPLMLSSAELSTRWFSKFSEAGPVTTKGCFKPEIIAIEMLQALYSIHQESYWDLLRGPFPVIPSEARQSREHPWWQNHGAQAVNKIVKTMQQLAPDGCVFEVRDEAFGFWRET